MAAAGLGRPAETSAIRLATCAISASSVSANARSNASTGVAAAAGVSRRHVRHSGPSAGASSPPIVHVPSSQQAILTAQWQPPRAEPAAARGRTAATVTRARTSEAVAVFMRGIGRGF